MATFKNINILSGGGVHLEDQPSNMVLITDSNSNIISSSITVDKLMSMAYYSLSGSNSTNERFLAGADVYRKFISFGALPNNTSKTMSTGITDANYIWIDVANSLIFSSGSAYPLPYTDPSNNANSVTVRITGNGQYITIQTGANWSGYSAYISLKYTKKTN